MPGCSLLDVSRRMRHVYSVAALAGVGARVGDTMRMSAVAGGLRLFSVKRSSDKHQAPTRCGAVCCGG